MIQILPSDQRFTADHGWLRSRFSFSFAEYYDPDNMQFGALRVFNDDTVQPSMGFGTHPHKEMEIISYVIEGALEHRDSMGNIGVLRAGEVQHMTAGTGVLHSEYNPSSEEPVHFLQLWFLPNENHLQPGYEQKAFDLELQKNCLLPVVSGMQQGEALHIHQDVTIYLSNLDGGQSVTHEQEAGRRLYVFVIEGELTLNGTEKMAKGDSARITKTQKLEVTTSNGANFMLIDLA